MKLMICLILGAHLLLACNGTDPMDNKLLPALSLQGLTIEEGNEPTPVFIDLRLSRASEESVSFKVQSQAGTARPFEDYTPVDSLVQVSPGTVVLPFRVDILGDDVVEEDEDFTIRLSQVTGAELEVSSAEITLLNDDVDTVVIPGTGYSSPESYPDMELVWRDEFDNGTLDNWRFEIGNNNGWGNNELEYYREENTFLKQGNLVIEARKENFGGRQYTSSRLVSRDQYEFTHGRVDIRAVLPQGQGIWPALWMLGSNHGSVGWPFCGEIDIMEMIGGGPGRDNVVHGTAHWANSSGQHVFHGGSRTLESGIFNDEFHVFSVIWDTDKIEWYLDNVKYYTLNTTAADMSELSDHNFFFIFNVAVGGNWPGSPNAQTKFPQRMIVDYVRVFQTPD